MDEMAVAGMDDGNGGTLAIEDCEGVIVSASNPAASLLVLERPDGWRGGMTVVLPDGWNEKLPRLEDPPAATRSQALSAARDELVRWLSDEKEKGGKKHRQQAESLQGKLIEMAFQAEEAPARASTGPVAFGLGWDHAAPQLWPLEQLDEAPNNPRGSLIEIGIAELAESMRKSGFRPWLPIVGRLLENGRAMIAAGHRRSRAARVAGLIDVPAVIKPMTDEEFLDILNFDNGGREDVHPLYEAAGWRDWMRATGKGVKDIADRIGQSKEYVYVRLKLDALIPEAKQAFLEGKFKIEHAVRIARRTEKVQQAALKFLEPKYNGQIPSTRELDAWLHGEQSEDLNEALFDRADVSLLAGAGSCASCPKLQVNDPGYIAPPPPEDEYEREEVQYRPQDCCLDPLCFRQKTTNHLAQIQTKLEEDNGGPVLRVSTNFSKLPKGVLSQDRYEKVNSGGQLALVVDGYNKGEAIRVRVKPDPKKESPEQAETRKREEVAAEAENKARDARELAIRERILDAVLVAAGGSLSVSDLRALLVQMLAGEDPNEYGEWLCRRHGLKPAATWQSAEEVAKSVPKLRDSEIASLAIEASMGPEFSEYHLDEAPTVLMELAKRHKVDAVKIRRQMEESAKEAEGGTRREVGAEEKKKVAKKAVAKKTPAKKKAAKPAVKKGGKK